MKNSSQLIMCGTARKQGLSKATLIAGLLLLIITAYLPTRVDAAVTLDSLMSALNRVESRVGNVEKSVNAIGATQVNVQLSNMAKTIDGLGRTMNTQVLPLNDKLNKVVSLTSPMADQLNKVVNLTNLIPGQFNKVGGQINQVSVQLTGQFNRIMSWEPKINQIAVVDQKVSILTQKLSAIEKKLDQLIQQVQSIKTQTKPSAPTPAPVTGNGTETSSKPAKPAKPEQPAEPAKPTEPTPPSQPLAPTEPTPPTPPTRRPAQQP